MQPPLSEQFVLLEGGAGKFLPFPDLTTLKLLWLFLASPDSSAFSELEADSQGHPTNHHESGQTLKTLPEPSLLS